MDAEDSDRAVVPRVDRDQLEITEELGEGRNSIVFGATLTLGDGRRVEAVVKENMKYPRRSSIFLHEAEILQALAGMRGVPRLYGVTKTSPRALVMSRCQGTTIKELKRRGQTRESLAAIPSLCSIVSAVHERRICHRDLHGGNVLVDLTGGGKDGDVWLIDFGQARMYGTRLTVEVDEAQVTKLTRSILRKMLQDSDQDVSRRCNDALKSLTSPMNLRQISCTARHVLYGSSTCPPRVP